MLGLYIHIPFCKHICAYCDFPKQLPKNEVQMDEYINRVCEELDSYNKQLNKCNTIYIGGGTPNALPLSSLEKLFVTINKYKGEVFEYSIELNPELITIDLIKMLIKYGVTRVSLGVQTFDNELILLLNRHHNKKNVIEAIDLLHRYGLHNINLDMMYGLPNQNMEDIKNDLKIIKSLDISHISYYSLILEEHTLLNNLVNQNKITLPNEDLIGDMSDYINSYLSSLGFKQYEISNFAKAGYESKHNLIYWDTNYYYGIGMRACGYIDSYRYQNQHTLAAYMNCDNFIETKEYISLDEAMKEFFLLGLRKNKGVSLNEFSKRFGKSAFQVFDLQKWIDKEMLEVNEDYISFTKRGINLGNIVFEDFV